MRSLFLRTLVSISEPTSRRRSRSNSVTSVIPQAISDELFVSAEEQGLYHAIVAVQTGKDLNQRLSLGAAFVESINDDHDRVKIS